MKEKFDRFEEGDWKEQLASAWRSPADLLRKLEIDAADMPDEVDLETSFPCLVPDAFVRCMQLGDAHDPLLRQVLPLRREHEVTPGFLTDPLQEQACRLAPGVLQKYHGRCLLLLSTGCPVHCRYCFRRHFPYQEQGAVQNRLDAALDHMRQDKSLTELIVSGGDPLLLDDDWWQQILQRVAAVSHVQVLRIHSRMPVVLPARVSERLCSYLGDSRLQVVMVVHSNHARELSDEVAVALQRLSAAGVRLYNQSVLLRGVNDDVTVLVQLSRRLFALAVQPYYLHRLDRVQGAAHFALSTEDERHLWQGMRQRLPGYLCPQWVQEVPGKPYKLPLVMDG